MLVFSVSIMFNQICHFSRHKSLNIWMRDSPNFFHIHQIRLSHATNRGVGCGPLDRPFHLGIKEVGDWLKQPQNKGIVIRLYFEVSWNILNMCTDMSCALLCLPFLFFFIFANFNILWSRLILNWWYGCIAMAYTSRTISKF